MRAGSLVAERSRTCRAAGAARRPAASRAPHDGQTMDQPAPAVFCVGQTGIWRDASGMGNPVSACRRARNSVLTSWRGGVGATLGPQMGAHRVPVAPSGVRSGQVPQEDAGRGRACLDRPMRGPDTGAMEAVRGVCRAGVCGGVLPADTADHFSRQGEDTAPDAGPAHGGVQRHPRGGSCGGRG